MALNKLKKMITEDEEVNGEDEYYSVEKVTLPSNSGKMILLEPQAKRIVDFLSGTVYAIGGDLQKIGGGIFLCTPKNVNVEGSISEEDEKGKKKNDVDLDW